MGKLAWLLLLAPTVSAQTITSFETEDWSSVIQPGGVRAARVQENASDGEWSLRVDFPGSDKDTWPGISWVPDEELGEHNAVSFDAYNPGKEAVPLSWRIDVEGQDAIFGGGSVQPGGPHTVDIWLVGMGKVTKVYPYVRMPRRDYTLYVDNFRWVDLGTDYFTPLHYVDETAPPEPTAEETDRGFLTFRRPLTDVVFENTVPLTGERITSVDAFATPGEYEPATFSLCALTDLTGVRVTFEGLPATGEVLPIRCLDKRVTYPSKQYIVGMPVLCERLEAIDLPPGSCKRFLIDLHIDEDAPPGIHEGEVHIDRAGGQRVTLPFRLRLLPYTLEDPEGMFWGEYYRGPMFAATDEAWSEILRRDMTDMREHGMTSVGLCFGAPIEQVEFGADGACALNLPGDSRYEQFMDLYRDLGYTAPVILLSDSGQAAASMDDVPYASAEWDARYGGFWTAMRGEHIGRGWPEVIVQPVDEPGWQDRDKKDRNIHCLKLLKQIPGMRTEQDGPGDAYFHDEAGPFADVWNYNGGISKGEVLDKAFADGKIVLIYNCDVESYRPEVDRYTAGWFQVASKTQGSFNWAYISYNGSPYDDQDHKTGTWMHIYPPLGDEPGGPSTGWTGTREGVDDYRYVHSLRQAIARAEGRGGRLRSAASSGAHALRSIVDSLQYSPGIRNGARWTKTGARPDGTRTIGGTLKLSNGWDHAEYEKNRWRVAQETMDVLAALGEMEVPKPTRVKVKRGGELLTNIQWSRAEAAPSAPVTGSGRAVTIPVWSEAPQIDADLSDPVWQEASRLDPFTLASGKGKPKMPTDVLVGSDGKQLFIAATCHEDNMANITATVAEDGGLVWQDDCIEVFVDHNLDRSTFKQVIVNSLGTQAWTAPGKPKWRAGSEAAAKQLDESWVAELAIPMADLGLTGEQFGLNVCRERRPMETLELSCWSPTGGSFGEPSAFGIASLGQSWIGALRVLPAVIGLNEFTATLKNESKVARAVIVELRVGRRKTSLEETPLTLEPGAELERTYSYEVTGDQHPPMTLHIQDAVNRELLAERTFTPTVLPMLQMDVQPGLYYTSEHSGTVNLEVNIGRELARGARLEVTLLSAAGRALRKTTVSEIEGNRLSAQLNLKGIPEGEFRVRARVVAEGRTGATREAAIQRINGPFS